MTAETEWYQVDDPDDTLDKFPPLVEARAENARLRRIMARILAVHGDVLDFPSWETPDLERGEWVTHQWEPCWECEGAGKETGAVSMDPADLALLRAITERQNRC